ncbi:MAG: hypothetical protein QCI38_05990 [Candidatus Thermoplasmatota archaeon]|nr:hypothetical protein [Candidatus Thermoplasmatota archaeon]
MKVKKLAEGDFDINLTPGDSSGMRLFHRDGLICLSISGVLLNDKSTWYELPIRDIRSINLDKNDEMKLTFVTDDFEVTIKSKSKSHMRALRHFLLPFITGTCT